MYGETFYGRHTAQHQLQRRQIKIQDVHSFKSSEHIRKKVDGPYYARLTNWRLSLRRTKSAIISWAGSNSQWLWTLTMINIWKLRTKSEEKQGPIVIQNEQQCT